MERLPQGIGRPNAVRIDWQGVHGAAQFVLIRFLNGGYRWQSARRSRLGEDPPTARILPKPHIDPRTVAKQLNPPQAGQPPQPVPARQQEPPCRILGGCSTVGTLGDSEPLTSPPVTVPARLEATPPRTAVAPPPETAFSCRSSPPSRPRALERNGCRLVRSTRASTPVDPR